MMFRPALYTLLSLGLVACAAEPQLPAQIRSSDAAQPGSPAGSGTLTALGLPSPGVLRTPDARFSNLPGYAFAPHYLEVPGLNGGRLRVHYVDEGPRNGRVIVLLHGVPSWSYLYRKMIPPLVRAGYRVIAPDLVGFGRSDKPARAEDYSYSRMVDWTASVINQLQLRDVTLYAQDWGGLIGLRLVAFDPGRYARVMISNTGLPDGTEPLPSGFFDWLNFVKFSPQLPVGQILEGGTVTTLSPQVTAAYDAPFPDETYQAGARILPQLVPLNAEDFEARLNQVAWFSLRFFNKPFLTAFSDSDPITRGLEGRFQRDVPGAARQPHVTITAAGHFLQEDKGEELARVLLSFIQRNP